MSGLVGLGLLLALSGAGRATGPAEPPAGPSCLARFTAGVPAFVLDRDASIRHGATFLGSPPSSRRSRDCMRACCALPSCNLALVELPPETGGPPGGGEDQPVTACYLLDCLYEQAFVCKFSRKQGFLNYLTRDVYHAYRDLQKHGFGGGSLIPRTWAGTDMKVQAQEPLVLRGTGDTEWHLRQGDASVRVEKKEPDQLEIWGLKEGTYVFQLTATDPDGRGDTDNVTITVLTSEQTAEYCLVPKKVGRCRGSFPRWYYNSTEQQCQAFVYGGCLGNKNNYLREEECKLACKDVQGAVVESRQNPDPPRHTCSEVCRASQFRCRNGCCIDAYLECDETSDCSDNSDETACDQYISGFDELKQADFPSEKGYCVDPPDSGLCEESQLRWYYNPFTERCSRFTYSGCHGNKNNFAGEQECLQACEGVSKKDVFGLRRETLTAGSASVEVAVAVFLATCIVVVLALLGYCFFKKRRKGSSRHRPPPPPTGASSTVSTAEDTEHLVYNHTTKPL
ncbi:LOW QUALITY PROTEIN: kunitz-type protease inhibitor 1 [Tachyglossus aculeatus]|uniref:LOW QUALITY PROTEIN: kunitz-type protease inhibitor 1 n=1 Tax=Tachyglossus aculeatus TaxID=9261 RepID=UPI0018F6C403|nr:LOW QUALITY PROTEIN: kunitz-type protease inhibitor 1 [Tachyglossus aculeatus]